ncbi:hypothetical protein CDES_09260 [Corynebacterium deserti GIMN1.010]|uniref:Uncharacterized protein n=1 Tax=Corynebacterium deserti GIMN1.010 TaxID=931089 RepID=A0A0M5IUF8_9CORY|nr:hypothetical protein [Corynebacterium deserti]ALC06244.1 hypothetical protein CDES_09260 [Corynebacterium deserti GIMN1.010]
MSDFKVEDIIQTYCDADYLEADTDVEVNTVGVWVTRSSMGVPLATSTLRSMMRTESASSVSSI